MSTFDERPKSRRSNSNPQSITVGYISTGIVGDGLVRQQAISATPALLYSISLGPLYRAAVTTEELGPAMYNVDVTWGPYEKKQPEPFDCKWSMNTTGGSRHVTQAIDTVASYGIGGWTVDHHGAIGVNENGDVEGTDIPDPVQEWTETYQLLLSNFGWNYADQVISPLTDMVNGSTFRGKPRGSVLFRGGTAARSSKDPMFLDTSLTFAFSRPITSGLTIGGITVPYKEGWQYLDFQYITQSPTALPWRPNKKLSQIDVKQMFYYGDFSAFGVGTGSLGVS